MNEALRAYFPVADMIAATFGPCCEAAIHDFSQPETSVVHVAGQVTGRKVGQSFDHLIKNVLLSKDFQNDQSNNYVFQTPDGRTIKSSSVLLRDGGHVIGMLCINYDLTIGQSFYQQVAAFYGGTQEDAANGEVDAADDVTSIIDGLIDSILRGTDAGQMHRLLRDLPAKAREEGDAALVGLHIDGHGFLRRVRRLTGIAAAVQAETEHDHHGHQQRGDQQ